MTFSMHMNKFRINLLVVGILMGIGVRMSAQEGLGRIPSEWKWLNDTEAAFTFDGTYADAGAFVSDLGGNIRFGPPAEALEGKAPSKQVEGIENATLSPDGSLMAYTQGGNLYVMRLSDGQGIALTGDGSETVYNGYAAWVYYEEIFGRASQYRAFWWSPDSRKLSFYRFDEGAVPEFPIYSPKGERGGSLRITHYPKAGDPNPKVRIGFVDVTKVFDGGAPQYAY